MERIQQEISNGNDVEAGAVYSSSYLAPSGGKMSNPQKHSFWAKGTGFGSGPTQQQWNVDLHVMKRKQDEQNVTYLLRVSFSLGRDNMLMVCMTFFDLTVFFDANKFLRLI